MSTKSVMSAVSAPLAQPAASPAKHEAALSSASAAFGLAAAIAILFNTLLAWVKDAYDPLNTAMARLTGHHWITHGLLDLAVFVVLGAVFLRNGIAARTSPNQLALQIVGAVILGGAGLAAWFVLV
ncbi:MAG TPA: hypothetical protein VFA50_22790 [Stellaceae bacterium]|nr:hypothetical protein [Stellaceae bacterium]